MSDEEDFDEDDDTVHCTLCGLGFDVCSIGEGIVVDGLYPLIGHSIPEQIKLCVGCAVRVSVATDLMFQDVEYCEHGVPCGDWCEACNLAYKQARIENE